MNVALSRNQTCATLKAGTEWLYNCNGNQLGECRYYISDATLYSPPPHIYNIHSLGYGQELSLFFPSGEQLSPDRKLLASSLRQVLPVAPRARRCNRVIQAAWETSPFFNADPFRPKFFCFALLARKRRQPCAYHGRERAASLRCLIQNWLIKNNPDARDILWKKSFSFMNIWYLDTIAQWLISNYTNCE